MGEITAIFGIGVAMFIIGVVVAMWGNSNNPQSPPHLPQYNIVCQAVNDGHVTLACVATPEETK